MAPQPIRRINHRRAKGTTHDEQSPPQDSPPAEKPTNYRAITRRTERNLIIGGFIIMFVVGGGLIALLWGIKAMLQSWLCIGGGALLLFVFVIIVGMRLTVRLVIDDTLADQTFVRK